MAPSQLRRVQRGRLPCLALLAGALLVAVLTHAPATAETIGGVPDNILPLMVCTACERVVDYLNKHFLSGVRFT
jgi:hypothetical protein